MEIINGMLNDIGIGIFGLEEQMGLSNIVKNHRHAIAIVIRPFPYWLRIP